MPLRISITLSDGGLAEALVNELRRSEFVVAEPEIADITIADAPEAGVLVTLSHKGFGPLSTILHASVNVGHVVAAIGRFAKPRV
jgi:hypothetical protein